MGVDNHRILCYHTPMEKRKFSDKVLPLTCRDVQNHVYEPVDWGEPNAKRSRMKIRCVHCWRTDTLWSDEWQKAGKLAHLGDDATKYRIPTKYLDKAVVMMDEGVSDTRGEMHGMVRVKE